MNFFDAQDNARRLTRWLVVVYCIATLLIIAGVTTVTAVAFYGFGSTGQAVPPTVLAFVAGLTLIVILGSSLYRIARLGAGGGRVAVEMGGVLVSADETDPLKRRYRNVVEEMAIASGVPVPETYVLDHEQGINAFAAGFSPDDAAIAVTRGTLELLDRDELQGVVAHEFSHILNGDMRLNIRLMGVLFGIMVLGLIGRSILRGGSRGAYVSSSRSKNAGGIVVVGLGLTILGFIGVFFARIIKAAVSRQREYLADASAVQFTRQTRGIADALKKIGGYKEHSYIRGKDTEEISHMLFAVGARLTSLFATHPPLTDRIRALEPSFDASQYPDVDRRRAASGSADDARAAGFAAAPESLRVETRDVVESIGQPGPAHIAYANKLHRSIPEELLAPAHSPEQAYLLVLALLVSNDAALANQQLEFLRRQLGDDRGRLLGRYYHDARQLGPRYTLPLLEVAFPALRRANDRQQEFLLDLARKLIEQDSVLDLREFCLYRVLSRSLANAAAPSRTGKGKAPKKATVRAAAVTLIRLLAEQGHAEPALQEKAARAGLQHFGRWAADMTEAPGGPADADTVGRFENTLNALQPLRGKAARTLLEAATATVLDDGRVTVTEAEMLRTVCASLGCPMPPVVAGAVVPG